MWSQNKKSFPEYLARLDTAKDFMSEGKVFFLYEAIRPIHRKAILAKLKEVDPGGLTELRNYVRDLRKAKRFEKDVALKEAVEEMEIIVAEAEWEEEGITKARFISADGIMKNIALCLASGYSRRETCERLGVPPELVAKISTEDIQMAKRHLPEAVTIAADKKVMHDLISGEVTQETARADLIAQRRRKTILDIAEEGRRQRTGTGDSTSPSATKADIEDQQNFFDAEFAEVEDKPVKTVEEAKEKEEKKK